MRTLAIGDIHGCSKALRTLLKAVKPGKDDLVITLGDYVDRGPDSKGVLDMLLELERTTQLRPLLGNHEILFMEAMQHQLDVEAWLRVGGQDTVLSYSPDGRTLSLKYVNPAHMEFISERCLKYYETDRQIFVHANANAMLPMAEQTDDWLFWTRFDDAYPHVSGKMMVCGHTAQKSGLPSVKSQAICLDTWAYGLGWLTCLDVEAGVFIQANQQGEINRLTFDELELASACLTAHL